MTDEPINIVLSNPAAEFPMLYRYARFRHKHPIRVSVPVVSGFRKAVAVAAALQFTVRLDLEQPDPAVVPELIEVLDFYLHDRSVRQPIEFFHSSLFALYHRTRITLWDIQERQQLNTVLQPECMACVYVQHCDGFFKSPRPDYVCDAVKQFLAKLTEAA